MLGNIKDFLYNLNPDIIVQAPSRINLINPLDAVEGDFWMPSVAINGINNPLSAFCYIKKIDQQSTLKIYKIKWVENYINLELIYKERLLKKKEEIRAKFRGRNKLFYACIYRLSNMYSCFEERFLDSNIEIGLLTTIPLQSGLGGSAALIIAILYGFTKYFNLYNNINILQNNEFPINKDTLAEIATKIEDEDLKITSGYADRYVISRGGLCFCSYQGKLLHKEISKEPLAIYDRIDQIYEIKELPIIICFSGVTHQSGDVHGRLRKLYLENNKKILSNYLKLAKIAWKARFAIMKQDWSLLGKYFRENTQIMNNVMEDAGFKYGIGLANNILIKIVEEHPEVYAAKLTGAGGGGSVFALVNPNKIKRVLNYWKEELTDLICNREKFRLKFPNLPLEIIKELENSQFFQIKIDKFGVKEI